MSFIYAMHDDKRNALMRYAEEFVIAVEYIIASNRVNNRIIISMIFFYFFVSHNMSGRIIPNEAKRTSVKFYGNVSVVIFGLF